MKRRLDMNSDSEESLLSGAITDFSLKSINFEGSLLIFNVVYGNQCRLCYSAFHSFNNYNVLWKNIEHLMFYQNFLNLT